MPQALNTGTCIQQGDLFYYAGQHRKKLGEVLEKMQVKFPHALVFGGKKRIQAFETLIAGERKNLHVVHKPATGCLLGKIKSDSGN